MDGLIHISSVDISENLDIRRLDDRWEGEILRRYGIPQINGFVNQDYLTIFTLAEDMIVIRFIMDYRQLNNGIQYSTQIIWNSRFSWREIIQQLEDNTYHFNFIPEFITVGNNYIPEEVNSRPGPTPSEVVDGLLDVIIRREDNRNCDEVECTVCYETFKNGENAKQLACTHFFHSNCIFLWFSRKMNCPTCRYDVAPD